jgi:hypothetical protein
VRRAFSSAAPYLVSFRALPGEFVFGRLGSTDPVFEVELGLIAGDARAPLGCQRGETSGPMDARGLAWFHFLSRPFVTGELAKSPWIKGF